MNDDIHYIDDDDFDYAIKKVKEMVRRIEESRGADRNAIRGLAYWQKLLAATYVSHAPYEQGETPSYRYLIKFRCDNGANGMDVVPLLITSDVEFHTKADLAPIVQGLQDNSGYQNVRILSFELYSENPGSTDR
jgi:hypothetical protein